MGGGLPNWTQIIDLELYTIINIIIRVNTKHEKIIIHSNATMKILDCDVQ